MRRRSMGVDTHGRRSLYQRHLKVLSKTKSALDTKPNVIMLSSALPTYKVRLDEMAYARIDSENRELLQKINYYSRFSGKTPSFMGKRVIGARSTRLNYANLRLKRIEQSNMSIGSKLLRVTSSLGTRGGIEKYKQELRRREVFSVPVETLEKFRSVVLPAEANMMEQLLRPKIFFDMAVRDLRPLGRVVIQLFTEACPEVVLEFVRMSTYNTIKLFHFIRIFPALWIEGELKFFGRSLREPNFEYNMFTLDHGHGPGIFSFAKCYLDGFKAGLLNFSISFKPLNVLNGERVPFGLVTRGQRVIDCLQDFGTKNGKTKKGIIVTKSGMFY